jgi:acyl carrier protein
MPETTTTIFKIKQYLVEYFSFITTPAEQIADEASFSSLGMDSLDNVEFIMEIEDRFEIEISDEEAEKITTVAEAAALVDKLIALKD